MSSAVEDLLQLLDLEPLEVNMFRGRSPQSNWQRVFGGQVVGQALATFRRIEGEVPIEAGTRTEAVARSAETVEPL